MAHAEQLKFVELVRDYFVDAAGIEVLEIGSYDVNGSIRGFFPGADYTGVDLTAGPGVDVVGSGHEGRFPAGKFDLAISCECFEHNPYWIETFLNMHRMTKEDGIVIVTCASMGRLEHGTGRTSPEVSPGTRARKIEYYRNLKASDFRKNLNMDALFFSYDFFYHPASKDLYFVGWKSAKIHGKRRVLFKRDVRNLTRTKARNRLTLRTIVTRVFDIPLAVAMRILSDSRYQDVAIKYIAFSYRIKKAINGIFRREVYDLSDMK